MLNLPNSSIWSIFPHAWDSLQVLLANSLQAIFSGAIDDAQRQGLRISKHGNVAIVELSGPMIKNAGWLQFYGFAGTKETQRAIEAAGVDDDVDRIIMNIDSPGGSVDGLAELADAVRATNKIKPVIAQVSGMCASAAYMIASQASAIYAGRMDLVGSIGTRMMLFDLSKYFGELGIKAIPIDTGEFKSAGAPGTEITENQIADFQRIVDGFFADFSAAVMSGRGMKKKQFKSIADGRVFFAHEAIELGLIDGLQSFDTTFRKNFKAPKKVSNRMRAETRLREQQTQI